MDREKVHLPSEIVFNIVSYLPLYDEQFNSLYSVCKEWRSILNVFVYERPRAISIIFCGNSYTGKTTTLSRLLDNMGYISTKPLEAVGTEEVYQNYGALMDVSSDEVKVGKTIHPKKRSYGSSPNRARCINLIDSPGSVLYVKNLNRPLSTADIVFFFVDASQPLPLDTTSLFMTLAAYGLSSHDRFAVIVNKMDAAGFSQTLFEQIKTEVGKIMKRCGIDDSKVPFIPVSTLYNINLVSNACDYYKVNEDSMAGFIEDTLNAMNDMKLSGTPNETHSDLEPIEHAPSMKWYKGPAISDLINNYDRVFKYNSIEDAARLLRNFDYNLLEQEMTKKNDENVVRAISTLVTEGQRRVLPCFPISHFPLLVDKPLRVVVHKVYKLSNVGLVAHGQVISGKLFPDQAVAIEPSHVESRIKSLYINKRPAEMAFPGDFVSFQLQSQVTPTMIYRGCIIGQLSRQKPCEAQSFIARMQCVGGLMENYKRGYQPILFCHAQYATVKIDDIIATVEKKSKTVIQQSPASFRKGDNVYIKFSVSLPDSQPLALEVYDNFPRLGRFVIRGTGDNSALVGIGSIQSIVPFERATVKPIAASKHYKISLANAAKATKKPAFQKEIIPKALVEETKKVWEKLNFMQEEWDDDSVDSVRNLQQYASTASKRLLKSNPNLLLKQ